MKKLFLTPLFALLILSGCVCTQGSGNIISETREVETFHSVDLSGEGNLYITQGDGPELRMETDDNILAELETEVKNGLLTIKPERTINCMNPTDSIDIYVTMEEVRNLSVSGSGTIVSETKIETDKLGIDISGSGALNLEVDVESLSIDISGSGEANVEGKATENNFKVSGSGDFRGFNLETERSTIKISGSGEADVWANESLGIKVSGSGDVRYKGGAAVTQNVSGSGSVERVKEEGDTNKEILEESMENSSPLMLEDFDLAIEYPESFVLNEDSSAPKNGEVVNLFFRGKNWEEDFENLPSEEWAKAQPKDIGFGLNISTPESIQSYIQERKNDELPDHCNQAEVQKNDPYCEEEDWNKLYEIYKMQKNILGNQKEEGEVEYVRITPFALHSTTDYELKSINGRNYLIYNKFPNLAGEVSRAYVTFIGDLRIELHTGWPVTIANSLHRYDKEADELLEEIVINKMEM